MENREELDDDLVITIPLNEIKCCGKWEGDEKEYSKLILVEKILPSLGEKVKQWQCPVCKGCY